MERVKKEPRVGLLAKTVAWFFILWGILHIWVGLEGIRHYVKDDARNLWNMIIGGSHAPRQAFQHVTDAITNHAQVQLLLNFVIDVGGHGVLAVALGWLIWKRASWAAYFIGVFVIGIADLTFLFALVTPGISELSASKVGGPVIWFIAVVLTPFGMPSLIGARDELA